MSNAKKKHVKPFGGSLILATYVSSLTSANLISLPEITLIQIKDGTLS